MAPRRELATKRSINEAHSVVGTGPSILLFLPVRTGTATLTSPRLVDTAVPSRSCPPAAAHPTTAGSVGVPLRKAGTSTGTSGRLRECTRAPLPGGRRFPLPRVSPFPSFCAARCPQNPPRPWRCQPPPRPSPPSSPPSPPPRALRRALLPLRAHRALAPRLGPVGTWRTFRAEVIKTQREKQQTEVAVEESFPVRETAPLDGADDPMVPTDESWVVKLEQSVNIFLTESVIMVLDNFYRDRNYARFFVLETIARVPYFAFISVLHMYETFGWWRRADYIKVHFAESWNEFHHLLIMEELGGNSLWVDRFLVRFVAFFYYFMTVAMYMLSPRMAYHFSECVERHAYSTYDKFLKLHEGVEKTTSSGGSFKLLPERGSLLICFRQQVPCSRRPKIDNLNDVFVNIRDDEAEHCKTMKACQTHGNLRSPHSMQNCLETDAGCVIPENDCEGIVDCVKKSHKQRLRPVLCVCVRHHSIQNFDDIMLIFLVPLKELGNSRPSFLYFSSLGHILQKSV